MKIQMMIMIQFQKMKQIFQSNFMNTNILPIENVVKNYDALLIDLWGVIHDGYAPYENAINFINKMIESKKHITFLSNSPRPGLVSKKLLMDWGMNINDIEIYTSGDAIRDQLVKWNDEVFSKLGRKFYHISEERNTDLLSGLNVNRTDNLSEANFILLSAYLDDDENINLFDDIFQEAVNLNIPAICVNPDLTIKHGPQLRYTAGTFAEIYKNLGGTVYYYGKPQQGVYNTVIDKYLKMNIPKSKILMIGDTLETDIKGASNVGIDSALVLTGNGKPIHEKINAKSLDIFTNNITPTWITYGMVKTY